MTPCHIIVIAEPLEPYRGNAQRRMAFSRHNV